MASEKEVEAAAVAIMNARGNRRGVPIISNVLDVLPQKLRDEVREDASVALAAAEREREQEKADASEG